MTKRCQAKTQEGNQCKNRTEEGHYCQIHSRLAEEGEVEPVAQDAESVREKSEGEIHPQEIYEEALHAFGKGDYEKVRRLLNKSAQKGHSLSQLALSSMAIYGLGGPVDKREGEKWWEEGLEEEKIDDRVFELARNDDLLAQYTMGEMYEFGHLVKSDYGEAVNWYQKAEIGGHPLAKFRLAHLYYYGLGVKQKNYDLVVQYHQQAADKGVGTAQFQIGRIFEEGFNVPQSYDQAVYWYKKSLDKEVDEAGRALRDLAAREIPQARQVLEQS